MSFSHLETIFQRVRFETRCPPFDSSTDDSNLVALTPYQITTSLSLAPRTMTDSEAEKMLQRYVDGEKEKVLKAGGSTRVGGGWAEGERHRVGDVLERMREKVSFTNLLVVLPNGWKLTSNSFFLAQRQLSQPNLRIHHAQKRMSILTSRLESFDLHPQPHSSFLPR